MKLCFDSIEEVRDFVKGLKGTRGGKGGDADDGNPVTGTAPAPLQPPIQTSGLASFQPQQSIPNAFNPGAAPQGFQPQGTVSVDPNVIGLVNRINAKIDAAVAGGQPAESVLNWFRQQCGAEAANATMDQIKQVFLFKQPLPSLENVAKLMNA